MTAAAVSSRERWRIWGPALALLALFLAVTVAAAARLPFWRDEMYTLATAGAGPVHAYDQAIRFEQQPPLYFVVMSLWRAVLPTLFEARLTSVLCAAAAVGVIAALARRAWPEIAPGWTVLLAGTAPPILWAATELRVYAFLLLLLALLFLCFHEAFLRERPRRVWVAGYVAVALAAFYSHYYAALFIAALVPVALVLGRWAAIRRLLLATALIGLGALPALAWFPSQVREISPASLRTDTTPARAAVHLALSDVETAAIPALPVLRRVIPEKTRGSMVAHWLFRLTIVAACLVALLAARRRPWPAVSRLAWPMIVLGVLAVEFSGLRVHFGPEALYARYLVGVALVFPLILVGAAAAWRPAGVLLVVAAALNLAAVATSDILVTKVSDLARVGAYLTAHSQPAETILVIPAADVPPFRLYYHGASEVRTVTCPVSEYRCMLEPGDSVFAAAQLAEAVRRGGAWVVIGPVVRWQRPMTEAMVRDIGRRFRLAEVRAFRGNAVVRHVLPR